MIDSFGNKLARDLVEDRTSKDTRRDPAELKKVAKRKLQMLHAARQIDDLRCPPGNRLEALKGDLKGYYSIRINDQWRITFRFENKSALEVRVEDYH